jgi:mRNA interferase RelE/StbE
LKSAFRASFGRDLKRIRSERVLAGVRQAILDVEAAAQWSDVADIKKLKGAANAYRIRVEDHRIGLFIEDDLAEFARVLQRRDIYRKFP